MEMCLCHIRWKYAEAQRREWLPLSLGPKWEVASETDDGGRKSSLKAQSGQAQAAGVEVTQEGQACKEAAWRDWSDSQSQRAWTLAMESEPNPTGTGASKDLDLVQTST